MIFYVVMFVLFSVNTLKAQVFNEGFEGTTIDMTSTSTGTGTWSINSRLFSEGTKCDSAVVQAASTIYLTSNSFSTLGQYDVNLNFDQICKITFLDDAYIEVSTDGTTWQRLTGSHYLGSGVFGNIGNKFYEYSYPLEWGGNIAVTPVQSWWKSESFDISSLAANSATVEVRFALIDGGVAGAEGRNGWFIDNVIINANYSELIKPSITLLNPIPQDTVFGNNDIELSAIISDASGIDTAICIYHIMPDNIFDTIGMEYDAITADTFNCQIPFSAYGRTTYYYIKAWDNSIVHNTDSTVTYHYVATNKTSSTAEIGDPTSTLTSRYPFTTYNKDAKTQFLYTASELIAAGANAGIVSSIAFDVMTVNTKVMDGFTVKMKNTTATQLTAFDATNLTTVYTDNNFAITATGWRVINLTSEFIWDGSSSIIVQVCFDNDSYANSSNVRVNWATNKTWQQRSDNGSGCLFVDGATYGTRPNIQISTIGTSDLTNDIGVANIITPNTGVNAGSSFNVIVDLANFGVDTITTSQINWSVNGVIKTPYTFGTPADTIFPNAIKSSVIIGTETATAGIQHLSVWSSFPNGTFDSNLLNDTASFTYYGCASSLSGTYTIGTGGSFASFNEAIIALEQCGISAPVVFNVNDGVYNEQITINDISGSSTTNTITFQSTSLDSTMATLAFDASSDLDNYVIRLNGTNNIIFKNMTFEAKDFTYARVFELTNYAHNLTFNNNIIKTESTVENDDNMVLILTTDSVGDNININNNALLNSSLAIHLEAGTVHSSNWNISDNYISGHYIKAIKLLNSFSATINNNEIIPSSTSQVYGYIGIGLYNSSGSPIITNNRINASNIETGYGIALETSVFSSSNHALVANNTINLHVNHPSGGFSAGVNNYASRNINIYNNSIHFDGIHPVSANIVLYDDIVGTTTNINIANNSLTNNADGYLVYTNNVDKSLYTINNNNLYKFDGTNPFAYLGNDVLDFTTYVTETGAMNSTNIDPSFTNSTGLQINNNLLNNTGITLASVTDDINGIIRDANTPDIGAFEFNAQAWDIIAIEVLTPMSNCGLTATESVTVRYRNIGSSNITGNFNASYQITGSSTTVTEAVTATIAAGDTIDYQFTTTANFDVNTLGADSVFGITAWAVLTGDLVQNNDTTSTEITSGFVPGVPVVIGDTINYGNAAILHAQGNQTYFWASSTSTNFLINDSVYVTPILYDTTEYWVSSRAGNGIDTIVVGTGTSTGAALPMDAYYGYSYSQSIYGANLFANSAGLIESIQYHYTGPGFGPVAVKVYIGHTTNNEYASSTSWLPISDLTEVYDGTLTAPTGGGWVEFVFNQAFEYNGTDNIVLAFEENTSGYNADGDEFFSSVDTSGNNVSIRYLNDYTNPDPSSPPSGTISTSYPNTKFIFNQTGCFGTRVPVTAIVESIPNNDAGATEIITADGTIFAGINTVMNVAITNFGASALTSLDINHKVNNGTATTYSWTGSIASQQTDTIAIGNIMLDPGIDTITSWTTNPNGTTDPENLNDTTSTVIIARLNGTYTIGDTTGGAVYDYPTFTAAAYDLNTFGVCAPVIFTVDNGVYTDRFTLGEIEGTSAINNITFTSLQGDSSSVTLQATNSAVNNHIIMLDGTDYITFSHLGFKVNTASYGKIFLIKDGANYIAIKNSKLESNYSNGLYGSAISGESSNNNFITITNNHIINCSYAIYLKGSSNSNPEMGHVITNNFIENFSLNGIYTEFADSITISNNRIESSTMGSSTNPTYYGINMNSCKNYITINANTILIKATHKTQGINISSSENAFGKRSLLSNNTIKIYDGNSDNYGIKFSGSTNMDIMYNSINIANSSIAGGGVDLSTSQAAADITFINNIVRDSVGYAIILSGTGISAMDNNAYYTTSTNFAKNGFNIANLTALQASTSMDAHSIIFDTQFVSASDLHLANSFLAGFGTPVSNVTLDMDGETRGTLKTTIGADEKNIAAFDIGVTAILNISDTIYQGSSNIPTAIVRNYGSDTIQAFDISYAISNGAAVVNNYSLTLYPFSTDTVTLTSFNAIAGNLQLCASTILTADTSTYNDTHCQNYYSYPTKDALLVDVASISDVCGMAYDTVKVRVTNIGIDIINQAGQSPTTISYQSNNNTIITETFTDVVAPFDTVWYSFNTLVYVGTNNMVDSTYDINAWINFPGDNDSSNDSISMSVFSPHTPAVPAYTNPLSVSYATTTTLNAISLSNDTINWFYDNISIDPVSSGNQFDIDWLVTQDTSMWLSTRATSLGAVFTLGKDTTYNASYLYPAPFANYKRGTKEQYLIKASELNEIGISAGPLTKIAFEISNMNSCPILKNYKVSIGASSLSDINNWEIGLVPVFSANNLSVSVGWNEIDFSTPFVWDGLSNIVVEICSQSTNFAYDGNASVTNSTTNFTSTISKRTYSANVCSATDYSQLYSQRPNIKFTGTGSRCTSQRVEYEIQVQAQPACDVSVTSSITQANVIYLTANEVITVEVTNYGSSSQTNIPISYSINGGAVVNEMITTSIPANGTLNYSFATTADLSTIGNYDFVFYTNLSCDNNKTNDTLVASMNHNLPDYCVSSSISTTYSAIKSMTVDNDSNLSSLPYNAMYSDFTNLGSFTTVVPSFTHQISIGITSMGTGISSVDAGYVKVFIDYNRDGVYDPIDEYAFGSNYNDVVGSDTVISGSFTVGNNVNIGTTQMRVVCKRNGTAANVTPCGTYYNGETEDYLINIAPFIQQDAGIQHIINALDYTDLSIIPLDVRVRNYGSSAINSVDIVYDVNGVINTHTYSTVIPVGNFADVSLGNVSINQGQNSICVKTVLAGDDNLFNDNKCYSIHQQACLNLSYSDDFESTDLWMAEVGSTQWERGVPTMSTINTAHSPVNVWAISLDTNYDNNSEEYLYTPKFKINNADSALLKFWHSYDSELGSDGGFIQYRINSASWIPLGVINDTRGTNWYNDATAGISKFSGNSNGWKESTFNFNFTTGEFFNTDTIQLRFNFKSNGTVNNFDGWAIDDFSFELPIMNNDIGVVAVTNPIATAQIGSPITVTVDIANFGSDSQSSFDVWYQIGSSSIVTETFTPTGGLASFDTLSYTFTTTAIAPSADFIVCSGTSLISDSYTQNDDKCSDIIVVTTAAIDAGVTAIGKIQNWGDSNTTSVLSPVVLKVEITNFGITALTSFDIEYSINNGSWVTETWTGNLLSNEVDTFVFATTYSSTFGNYNICVRTVLPNDAYSANDMLCKTYVGTTIKDANGIIFEVSQNEPNPAVGSFRINYIVPTNGDINLELINTLGQVIYTTKQASFTGKNSIEVDANNLPNGIYYYSITFNGQRITRKMIVNK